MLSSAVSCDTEELHDLNINPQAVNEVDLNFIFTAAQLGAASGGSVGNSDNRYIDWRVNIGVAAHVIQQLGSDGSIRSGDFYTENSEADNAPWEFIYEDNLKNLAEILRQTDEGGFAEGKNANLRQAARIMKAYLFHRLTDYYGNIPYSEANQGIQGIFFPKYDRQEDIYPDLMRELSEASAALSTSNPDDGFSKADLYFDGDVSKWKKFGYSMLLRLAMRVSNVAPNLTTQYVTEALNGGVMTSNEDNVLVPMASGPSEWTNQNGISRAFGAAPNYYLSDRFIDELMGANAGDASDDDPRLMIFSSGINGDINPLNQHGLPNGLDGDDLKAYEGLPDDAAFSAAEHYSRINGGFLNVDEPYMIMNYAEVEFLQAEAAEKNIGGLSTAQAASHYNAGVRAAMQMLTTYDASFTVSDAQVDSYLATYPYAGTQPEKLEMIGTQMWISKWLNWWDAWADWRRTDYPVLVPTNHESSATGGVPITKLRIPEGEQASNLENYIGDGSADNPGATKPDNLTGKVWWDGGE